LYGSHNALGTFGGSGSPCGATGTNSRAGAATRVAGAIVGVGVRSWVGVALGVTVGVALGVCLSCPGGGPVGGPGRSIGGFALVGVVV
jgi:hypothetical protein